MGLSTISEIDVTQEYSFFLAYIFGLVKNILDLTKQLSFWDGIFAVIIFLLIKYLFIDRKRYKPVSMTLNIPFSLGNVTYRLTDEDRIVAWKLYIQLKTRKAALIFDEEDDVIIDVYDSLYEMFKESRQLLVNLPLYEIETEPSIADLVLRVQNDGLRPHLTKWQSDFRKWWGHAIRNAEYRNTTPQNIQRRYPKYTEMVRELKDMNLELNKYAEYLLTIAKTRSRTERKAKMRKPIPVQPSTLAEST